MFLTKSDYKVGRQCPTKLFYKKNRYPSLNEINPYLTFLADGGYMVETMAKLLYPKGREMGHWDDPVKAFAQTKKAVQSGGVLFEATVLNGKMMARMDILEMEGNKLRLIEVKSSSVNSEEDGPNPFRGVRGGIISKWRPYLEDVAFQSWVLGNAFPDLEIIPMLCVVDKAKEATEDTVCQQFRLKKSEDKNRRGCPDISFLGDAGSLRANHLLSIIDVSEEVAELTPEVARIAEELASSLNGDTCKKIPQPLSYKCKQCEYRVSTDEKQNGFSECWNDLPEVEHHVLDLYRIDLAGGRDHDIIGNMVAKGQTSILDVPSGFLTGQAAHHHFGSCSRLLSFHTNYTVFGSAFLTQRK